MVSEVGLVGASKALKAGGFFPAVGGLAGISGNLKWGCGTLRFTGQKAGATGVESRELAKEKRDRPFRNVEAREFSEFLKL